jgi:hypothetical protein
MITPVRDEVDDTSILKTGGPACYLCIRDFISNQATYRSKLSRSDLVLWPDAEVLEGSDYFRFRGEPAVPANARDGGR